MQGPRSSWRGKGELLQVLWKNPAMPKRVGAAWEKFREPCNSYRYGIDPGISTGK
jgi:hypothetical protein